MSRNEAIVSIESVLRSEIPSDVMTNASITILAGIIADAVRLQPSVTAVGWELIHDVAFEHVRRMRVPSGWMYQTEIDQIDVAGSRAIGWHPPIFVPDTGTGATP